MTPMNQRCCKELFSDHFCPLFRSKQDAIEGKFGSRVKLDDILKDFSDDYLYGYYVSQGRFDKYFSPEKYMFCSVNSSLRIGSFYFQEGRVRCAHSFFATYMILETEKMSHMRGKVTDILKPININPTADDKDNLVSVFNQYFDAAYPKHPCPFKGSWAVYFEQYVSTLDSIQAAFNKQISDANFENALYILLCLLGVLSIEEKGLYEKAFCKFESNLGEDGYLYTRLMEHYSRGLAINLRFDMSHFFEFVSNLPFAADMCHLHSVDNIDGEEFNRIADAFVDSITPDFLKNQSLYNNQIRVDSEFLKACSEDMQKFI